MINHGTISPPFNRINTTISTIMKAVLKNLIRKNAANHHADLEQYIESHQFLKEKNITPIEKLQQESREIT